MIDWFYSDPHFGHSKIVELAGRPFADIDEHDAILVRRYNERVRPDDVVLWLGDAFLCPTERARTIVAQLNGRKLSLVGNHDAHRSARWLARLGFVVVEGELLLQLGTHSIRCSHYPYAGAGHAKGADDRYLDQRPARRKGETLVHGHSHARCRFRDNAVHVGVDAWDYYPVSRAEVLALIESGGRALPSRDAVGLVTEGHGETVARGDEETVPR